MDFNGNRRCAAQRFHEHIILMNTASQIIGQRRQWFSVRLADVEYGYHPVLGNPDFDFLCLDIAVLVQNRRFGIGIDHRLLGFYGIRRGRNDLDRAFALQDMTLKLIAPFSESRN